MTNKRAKDLFEKVGIRCECEPDWIEEGKRPDFYCSGGVEFWCEVKTLEPSGDSKLLGNAFVELRKRALSISLPGRGIAYVNDSLDHRDAKIVMHLAKRALSRLSDSDAPKRAIALIPSDPDYGKFVRFSISTKDHSTAEFHSCISAAGKYGGPYGMIPEPYTQMTRLRFSSGEEKEVRARNVMTLTDDFRVAIVIQSDDRPFRLMATMPTGMAKKSRNPERIRDAVGEANNQLKNGTAYKAAPCLLMLFHDGIDVPEEEIIKSALYGDLKYAFSPDRFEDGKLILDSNGAWNPNKNRTTSAVMYVWPAPGLDDTRLS